MRFPIILVLCAVVTWRCTPPCQYPEPAVVFASGFELLLADGAPVSWAIERGAWGAAAAITTVLPNTGRYSVALLRSDTYVYTDPIAIEPALCYRLEYSVLSHVKLAYGAVGLLWMSKGVAMSDAPISVFSAVGAYGYEHHYEEWCPPRDADAAQITLHRFYNSASAQFDDVRLSSIVY